MFDFYKKRDKLFHKNAVEQSKSISPHSHIVPLIPSCEAPLSPTRSASHKTFLPKPTFYSPAKPSSASCHQPRYRKTTHFQQIPPAKHLSAPPEALHLEHFCQNHHSTQQRSTSQPHHTRLATSHQLHQPQGNQHFVTKIAI